MIFIGNFCGASADGTLAERVIAHYAARSLPSWEEEGKVHAPRVVLAKLYNGQQVEGVNEYLRAQRPWAGAGSDWDFGFMGFKGDYDFTLATLMPILYLFGDDPEVLFPETREHLLQTLIVERDEPGWELTGGEPRLTAPGSFGLVPETENHILMTEGSRYLKNQWIREIEGYEDAEYDNLENGLENWLLEYLEGILKFDFNEFNSIPYEGYAVQGVLNLAAFAASEPVRTRAKEILDDMARRYVAGSLDFRRYPPFNRQGQRAADRDFGNDRLTAIMRIWADDPLGQTIGPSLRHAHQMLPAAVLDYRPPAEVMGALLAQRKPYLLRFGRGATGSPEIYYGGPGYLISSGGSSRSLENTARQTVLFLDDGASDILYQSFYLEGSGDRAFWNHTGVYTNFACGLGPVYVPSRYDSEASSANWDVFRPYPEDGLRVAVHNGERRGLLVLFPEHEGSGEDLVASLEDGNADPDELRTRFRFPSGPEITYDLEPGRNTWVIESVDGEPMERSFDNWPRPREALKNVSEAFSVEPLLPGREKTGKVWAGEGRSRPALYFLEVPPDRDELTVEFSGFSTQGSGLLVGRKLPKLNLEPTSDAIRIEEPPAGLYWIGAYALNAEKEFGVRVEYLPQAKSFREWDLWERGGEAIREEPLVPTDFPSGSDHPWWFRYALPRAYGGEDISLSEEGVRFFVRGDAIDLEYHLESSTDLQTWTPVEGVEKIGEAPPWHVYQSGAKFFENRRFFRVRVIFDPE